MPKSSIQYLYNSFLYDDWADIDLDPVDTVLEIKYTASDIYRNEGGVFQDVDINYAYLLIIEGGKMIGECKVTDHHKLEPIIHNLLK